MQTKALYNLLRIQAGEDSSLDAEKWAMEDLRQTSTDEIFARLKKRNIDLDKKAFIQFAENCDTPEDLAELLSSESEEDEKLYDSLYLLVFELWRRFLPEKQSLSIFADELDRRIEMYDLGELESDEQIQDALANLLEILEENSDAGADPQEILKAISEYCAHDLESFLIDYIAEILDSENEAYASELIEGFSPYVTEIPWFEFLKARVELFKNSSAANRKIRNLLEEESDPALILEILRFLTCEGEQDLFVLAIKKILPLLKKEEELLEVMEIAADYYRRLDQEEVEQAIQKLLQKKKSATGPLNPSDAGLKTFGQLIAR